MATFRLDFVHSFIDARGKLRHVFRRNGHKTVTIKGRPSSPEFMDEYHALLERTGGTLPQNIGASLNKEGTIDALILRYVKHNTFIKGLALATQNMRRPILDHFRNFRHRAVAATVPTSLRECSGTMSPPYSQARHRTHSATGSRRSGA